ncbi:arrestin domain-containing protein 3-like [Protopterus annectens]|uniref:arrestin domain-containing protein 3-like n=1 Tax=Protopterus annectens TaxID=7888 RepID=UPI001CF9B67A|nr:arrestin domain-containing protein 3-like [Protopterus annectens]
MERMGYTPGESLPIIVEIQNKSSRSVVPEAAIYQMQSFFSKSNKTKVLTRLIKMNGQQVSAKTSETWNCQIYVPQYPPPVLNCSILRMEYALKVRLKITGSSSLKICMPLIIGSIPVQSVYSSDFVTQPFSYITI